MNRKKFDFKPIGKAIKAARSDRGLSRNGLADLVYISPRYIASIENNGQHPSLQVFYDIVTELNLSVDKYFYPEAQDNKSELRDRLDALLDTLNDKDLNVIMAAAKALRDRK